MAVLSEPKLAADDVVTRDHVSLLREELATANANLAAFLEQRQATAQREQDLRLALHEAHEELVRRDDELAGALQECLKRPSQSEELSRLWLERDNALLERDNALQECLKQRSRCEELSRLSLERHNEVLCLSAEQHTCHVYIAVLTADRDALLERVKRFRRSFVGFLYRRAKRLGLWR